MPWKTSRPEGWGLAPEGSERGLCRLLLVSGQAPGLKLQAVPGVGVKPSSACGGDLRRAEAGDPQLGELLHQAELERASSV